MFNEILMGKASLEVKPPPADPYRGRGSEKSLAQIRVAREPFAGGTNRLRVDVARVVDGRARPGDGLPTTRAGRGPHGGGDEVGGSTTGHPVGDLCGAITHWSGSF